jgi:hypothetical protein
VRPTSSPGALWPSPLPAQRAVARSLGPVRGAGHAAPPPSTLARGDVQARTGRLGGAYQAQRTALNATVGWRDPSLCLHPSRPGSGRRCAGGLRLADREGSNAPKTGVGVTSGKYPSARDRDRPRSANVSDDDQYRAVGPVGEITRYAQFRRPDSRSPPLRIPSDKNAEQSKVLQAEATGRHCPAEGELIRGELLHGALQPATSD